MSEPPRPWRRVAAHGGLAVLLIRHGRTAFNAQRRFCGGRSDPPLDARGCEEVGALGLRFAGELERVYCSPQRRALATAAVLGLEPTVIEGLRELDQGALEGLEFQASLAEHAEFFRAWKADPGEVAVPGGGESMRLLADRVALAMDRIVADHDAEPRGRVVGVVGHQMAQAAFVCRALGEPLRRWQEFELRNATANLLVWDGRGWSLLGRNL
jgi:broad specificity phosphatase PhoE